MPEELRPPSIITCLTRTLKKPEERERAEEFLGEVLKDRRLKFMPNPSRLGWWISWLLVAAVAALCWFHYNKAYVTFHEIELGESLSMQIAGPVPPEGLTQQEQWFFGVDPTEQDIETKRKLHESDPRNAFYYMHYALAHVENSEDTALPEGYFDAIAILDIDNASPLLLAAGAIAHSSSVRGQQIGEAQELIAYKGVNLPVPLLPHHFDIVDEAGLMHALDLFEQALRQEHYCSFLKDHVVEALDILEDRDPSETYFANVRRMSMALPAPGTELNKVRLGELLGALARLAEEQEDEELFLKLVDLRDAYLKAEFDRECITLISSLVVEKVAYATAAEFLHTSKQLGLAKQEARFEAEVRGFHERNTQERRRRADKQFDPYLALLTPRLAHAHRPLVSAFSRQVQDLPRLTLKDIKPMRQAEHELASQWLTMGAMVLLLLFWPLLWLTRFLFPKFLRKPAAQASHLLDRSDWELVLLVGLLVPTILYWLVVILSPLGCRHFAIPSLGYAYPALPMLILIIAMMTLSAFLIRRRVTEQLNLGPTHAIHEAVYYGILLLLIVLLFGAFMKLTTPASKGVTSGNAHRALMLFIWLGGLLSIWLIWALCVRIWGGPAARLRMACTLCLLPRCIPVAILCLGVLLPIHRAGELHWMRREMMTTLDPSERDFGLYEGKVARQVHQEIKDIVFADGQSKAEPAN